jgi:putative aldouronate transport system substrate-binding protein
MIPSADGTPAKAQLNFSINYFPVVNKDFEHPEALVQMLNLFVERTTSDPETYLKFGTGSDGTMYSRFAPVTTLDPDDTRGVYLKTMEAIKTGDCTTLVGTFQSRCEMIVDWSKTGNPEYWNVARQQGPDSSFSVIDKYYNADLFIHPAYIGGATPAIIANQGALITLENETFAKIITGAVGIDEFDNFVENWKKLGGEQMTKEVNEKAERMK